MKFAYCLVTVLMIFGVAACSKEEAVNDAKKESPSAATYTEHQKEMADAASKLK